MSKAATTVLWGLLISVCCFLYGLVSFPNVLTPSWYGWLGAILTLSLLGAAIYFKWPLPCLLRLSLVISPGLVVALFVLLGRSKVLFTASAMRYQTDWLAVEILLLSVLAAYSSTVGWVLAGDGLRSEVTVAPLPDNQFRTRFLLYAGIAVVCGTMAAGALSGFFWQGSFDYVGMRPAWNIGIFSVFAIFSILGMYLLLLIQPGARKSYWLTFSIIAIYVLVFCLLLRGARLDVAGILIAAYAVTQLYKRYPVKPFRLMGYALLGIVVVQFLGKWRHQSIHGAGDFSFEILPTGFIDGVPYPHLPTLADVAATLFQVVGLIHEGYLSLQMGETYWNYFPRTLPYFLYPGRPLDFSISGINGQAMTGSLFELTEAYVNFGVVGCMLIPAGITYVFGRAYRHAHTHPSFGSYMLYGLLIAIVIRGTWYQNFSFYKATLSWAIMEGLIAVLMIISNKLTGHYGKAGVA
ncbi:MAG: hypothetical protein AB1513_10650 [Pseudomonadota bacterium]